MWEIKCGNGSVIIRKRSQVLVIEMKLCGNGSVVFLKRRKVAWERK